MEKLNFKILNTDKMPPQMQVSVADTFISSTEEFHPQGLYSPTIFGQKGSKERNTYEGFIDLKLPVLHPEIFAMIEKSSRLYLDVMAGTKYAIFDKKTNTLEPASIEDGETGYQFFMSVLPKLTLKDTGSLARSRTIKGLDKSRKNLTFTKLLVGPAGLREYSIDEDGRAVEDEINDLYRSLIHSSNLIPSATATDTTFDRLRWRIQLKLDELNKYVNSVVYGKKKWINQKVAGRSILGGTRNIATGLTQQSPDLDSKNFIGPNQAMVGLYQVAKGTVIRFTHFARTGIMTRVMPGDGIDFNVINPETLQRTSMEFGYKLYEKFMTGEGINDILNTLEQYENFDKPVMIGDFYAALVYDSPTEYCYFTDLDEFSTSLDRKYVRPMTYMDYVYMHVLEYADNMYATTTRYPCVNVGGIYPVKVELKVTSIDVRKYEIDPSGERTGRIAERHPIPNKGYYSGVGVNMAHYAALALDFDGDTLSLNFISTNEAVKEIQDIFKTAAYYQNGVGNVQFSMSNSFTERVFSWSK